MHQGGRAKKKKIEHHFTLGELKRGGKSGEANGSNQITNKKITGERQGKERGDFKVKRAQSQIQEAGKGSKRRKRFQEKN